MKRAMVMLVATFAVALMSGCGVNKKAQIEALARCTYSIESIDKMLVGGKAIESFDSGNGVDIASLPSIAFAILRQDLPLEAKVNLKVANTNQKLAAINQFKYLIEIKGTPIFEGTVDENIKLSTGESTLVPLSFKLNLFGKDKNNKFLEQIVEEVFKKEKSDSFMTLKIKPSVKIGGSNIYYPTYITVDHNLLKKLKI